MLSRTNIKLGSNYGSQYRKSAKSFGMEKIAQTINQPFIGILKHLENKSEVFKHVTHFIAHRFRKR